MQVPFDIDESRLERYSALMFGMLGWARVRRVIDLLQTQMAFTSPAPLRTRGVRNRIEERAGFSLGALSRRKPLSSYCISNAFAQNSILGFNTGRCRAIATRCCAYSEQANNGVNRLQALRSAMSSAKVDALIVPTTDPHNSEYAPDCFARRSYISGFDGSAGTVVITSDAALLWTDGRYFLQAEKQLGDKWTLMRAGVGDTPTLEAYLASELPEGGRVGIDPFVHSISAVETLLKELTKSKKELVLLDNNLVDAVWEERPAMPSSALRVHPMQFAGQSISDKLDEVAKRLQEKHVDALLVSMLDEVAWLLNVRGDDIPCCPVALSYAIVRKDGSAVLYIDEGKIGDTVMEQLNASNVRVAPYDSARDEVESLANQGERVWLDPSSTSLAMCSAANKKELHHVERSPIAMMKAVKNDAEVAGMVEAHIKDGAALANFFCWLENGVREGHDISEVEAADRLEEFRAEQPGFLGVSFPTIAGFGANGAIIHYRAEPSSCAHITTNDLFLLDSGGQYIDGTTDVTRTMHFGEPSKRQKECFTRVLQGHIALDRAVFPHGTCGMMIDSFARMPLWRAGLDFRHGTGHGVGACLNVHEGPQSISPRPNTTPLTAGMIVSDEPGYYEDGSFGIRIENLLLVEDAGTPERFNDKQYLRFTRLTHAPIQAKMIDLELLSDAELEWLNHYHGEVWARVSPRLSGPALDWYTGLLSKLRRNVQPQRRRKLNDNDAESSQTTLSRREVMTSAALLATGALTSLFGESGIGEARADDAVVAPVDSIDPTKDAPKITDRCYLDIAIGDRHAGRVTVGLYGDILPKTTKNFVQLCRGDPGFGYRDTDFYRVVSGLTIQAGDVAMKGGRGGRSIYGDRFEQESLRIRHTLEGTLSMVNSVSKKNDSRFFITTRADSDYLDGRYVAFGRVLDGLDVVHKIDQVRVRGAENRPVSAVRIVECGTL